MHENKIACTWKYPQNFNLADFCTVVASQLKPVAFHWALPAEPYNPRHQNVGPTSFSQPSLLLSACWIRAGGFVGHVSWRANAPFKSVSSALHSFEQSDGGGIQGVKGVPPECGSSVVLWHGSFSLGGVSHLRTHFWSSFPKNYHPNTDLVSFKPTSFMRTFSFVF